MNEMHRVHTSLAPLPQNRIFAVKWLTYSVMSHHLFNSKESLLFACLHLFVCFRAHALESASLLLAWGKPHIRPHIHALPEINFRTACLFVRAFALCWQNSRMSWLYLRWSIFRCSTLINHFTLYEVFKVHNRFINNVKTEWAWEDSNFRPHAYQACALTGWATSPFQSGSHLLSHAVSSIVPSAA